MENFKKILSEKLNSKYYAMFIRLFKWFLTGFSVLFLIMLSLSFIDLNPHKEKIERLILDKTGYSVILEGVITVHAFPFLALEAEHVHVKEKLTQKKESVKIEKMKMAFSPSSLIPGRIVLYLTLFDTQFKSYYLSELKTKMTFKSESLELNKNKIKLKKDQDKFIELDHLKIVTNQDEPHFYLQHESSDFQLDLLMSQFLPENKIEGKTALKLALTAEGRSVKQLKKTLNGHIDLEITEGRFYGLDLIASLKEAKSLFMSVGSSLGRTLSSVIEKVILKKHKVSHEKTPFHHFKLSATIQEGIIKNQILQLNHAKYTLNGIGQCNLSQETVDYQLKAVYKDKPKMKFFGRGLTASDSAPLIIHISGPIKDPHIKTDMRSYLKYIR